MGKTIRRKGFDYPLGRAMMKEKKEKPRSQEWYDHKKQEKKLQQKLRKLKRKT